jgi:hypothetical protein
MNTYKIHSDDLCNKRVAIMSVFQVLTFSELKYLGTINALLLFLSTQSPFLVGNLISLLATSY